VDDDLAEIWQTAKPTLLERCEVVRRAADSGDVTTFASARAESHKLAGTVGMFDLPAAAALAAALDELVTADGLEGARRDEVAATAGRLAQALEDER
jgi:HPt (histidine-containing phosphotransfer) domain-containing protein